MSRSNELDWLSSVQPPSPSDAQTAAASGSDAWGSDLWEKPSGDSANQEWQKIPGPFHRVCLFVVCANFLVAFSNEFSYRLFHGKAYLSTVTIVLLPIAVLMTGNLLRGMRVGFGKWWLAFGLWLAVCAPFSYWRSDTLLVLRDFYARSFLLYFAICACVLTIQQAKKVMHTLAFSTVLVVITCAVFGAVSGDGRFAVPFSNFSFFSNSNELALQLVFGIIILIFPFFERGMAWKLLAFVLIPASGMYTLKTGSRGTLLASIAVGLTLLFLSRSKGKLIAFMAFCIVIALVATPPEARHRLLSVTLNPTADTSTDENVRSAIASQEARKNILWQSVDMTLHHPIFGVGPGEFAAAQFAIITAKGEWSVWIGTHNSYTQVSSESGIPGFIFYVATIFVCLRINYRLYRLCSARDDLKEHAGISLCMLLGTVLYMVGTLFFHIAYGTFLPTIAGLTAAIYFITRRDSAALDAPQPAPHDYAHEIVPGQ